jgi:hypothetical protein
MEPKGNGILHGSEFARESLRPTEGGANSRPQAGSMAQRMTSRSQRIMLETKERSQPKERQPDENKKDRARKRGPGLEL